MINRGLWIKRAMVRLQNSQVITGVISLGVEYSFSRIRDETAKRWLRVSVNRVKLLSLCPNYLKPRINHSIRKFKHRDNILVAGINVNIFPNVESNLREMSTNCIYNLRTRNNRIRDLHKITIVTFEPNRDE